MSDRAVRFDLNTWTALVWDLMRPPSVFTCNQRGVANVLLCRYNERLRGLLCDFAARFSDIHGIYRQVRMQVS